MRPDYTLSLWPAGFEQEEAEKQELITHVHFDAKYKVDNLVQQFGKNEQDLTEEDAAPQLLHFVALGNNTLELDAQTPADWGVAEAFIPVLHQAEWHDIAHALPGLQVNAIASDRAVLDDLRDAFALFGIAVQPAFQWPELLAWAGSCGLDCGRAGNHHLAHHPAYPAGQCWRVEHYP